MNILPTALPEVLLLQPVVHRDGRGSFLEAWSQQALDALLGQPVRFVQDNHSVSRLGVLRGLHFQRHHPQGKLVRVAAGRIFDVVVDVRRGSPRFGRWDAVELDAGDPRLLWIPPGFAHGFLALSDGAAVDYKVTAPYRPADERALAWDDPALGIRWPLDRLPAFPLLSPRDAAAPRLDQADLPD